MFNQTIGILKADEFILANWQRVEWIQVHLFLGIKYAGLALKNVKYL